MGGDENHVKRLFPIGSAKSAMMWHQERCSSNQIIAGSRVSLMGALRTNPFRPIVLRGRRKTEHAARPCQFDYSWFCRIFQAWAGIGTWASVESCARCTAKLHKLLRAIKVRGRINKQFVQKDLPANFILTNCDDARRVAGQRRTAANIQ